ncbi:MAG: dephospho-CoA kinase [Ferruginibacter sp.]
MLKIGITGGIGSGKSTVAKVFEVLGIPVYNADLAAKRLMNEDAELKEKIKQQFGNDVYKNEKLDNKYLAHIVFASEEKLDILNSIVHPATINDANAWMLKQTTPYTLKEAALLFESGAYELLDYVIGISAPAPLRLQRVMQRDGSSREEIMARMNKQMDEEIKMKLCNFIIKNDEQQLLIPQVVALHETILSLAENK